MTMFVTGGTSSIGRIFVKEMSDRGLPVRALVRRNSRREVLDFPGVTFMEGNGTPQSNRKRRLVYSGTLPTSMVYSFSPSWPGSLVPSHWTNREKVKVPVSSGVPTILTEFSLLTLSRVRPSGSFPC